MERAIVTFQDPIMGQKIIFNFTTLENGDLDYKIKFDPTPDEDEQLGLISGLATVFTKALHNGQNNTI